MINKTDITVILDRSGSMSQVRDATISGFNEFIGQQKAEKGKAVLTLVQFDGIYEVNYKSLPIGSVENLTTRTFVPRGRTALNDAIGRTIDDIGERLHDTRERYRPDKVIVVIMTDGEENASTKYSIEQVAKMVKHQQDAYDWTFLFVGANQDAVLTGKKYNFKYGETITYDAGSTGTRSAFLAINSVVTGHRVGGQSKTFTADMRKKAVEKDAI